MTPDTLTAEQAEIARLVKIIESEVASWERQARDADPDDPYDERGYSQDRADRLRTALTRTEQAREISALVAGVEKAVREAEWAQRKAEGELHRYRKQMELLEGFAGWLRAEFGDLFNVERLVDTFPPDAPQAVIVYTNWRGETATRRIVPGRIWFGSTEWHRDEQYLLRAWDVEKAAVRDFALRDVCEWREGKPE